MISLSLPQKSLIVGCWVMLILSDQSSSKTSCSAFTTSGSHHHGSSTPRTTAMTILKMSDSAARELLYQDQQKAMLRRSIYEEELLASGGRKPSELKAPKLKATVQSGTGFAAPIKDEKTRLAVHQAKVLRKDGVIRIDEALAPKLADQLREYVLEQQALALAATQADPSLSRTFYGVEQSRAHRCDLQLSLLRGGFAADGPDFMTSDKDDDSPQHVLADVLQKLLGANGSLRAIYEKLVTLEGEFYELGAVVTDPGSNRQVVHPDLPFKDKAPLYVIFLALQDVDEDMGPTSFLVGTQTKKENAKFNDPEQKDEQLTKADCKLSTLKKGDAVSFDARVLHCGNANDPVRGKTRALFNFSFRNPQVTGNLGYDGSIRPGYCQAMTLGDVSDALDSYAKGDPDPFAKYGSGLLQL